MNGTKTSSFKLFLLFLLGIGVVGYGLFSFRFVFHGPRFTIEEPLDGSVITNGVVEVKGRVPFATNTTIDGRTLYIDESGAFSEKLVVKDGPVIITLYAQDRFGRETTETIELYAKNSRPSENQSAILSDL